LVAPTTAGGGFRASKRRHRRARPMSEINVTPFVDVMLVLLIVFMVTAPLLSAGVPVDLPEATAKPLAVEKTPIAVTVNNAGKIFVNDDEVPLDQLVLKLTAVAKDGLEERIYVRGDKAVSYGTVMQVMGTINAAGFKHLALVSLKEPDK
jgi:biopolymer transport protein TolR